MWNATEKSKVKFNEIVIFPFSLKIHRKIYKVVYDPPIARAQSYRELLANHEVKGNESIAKQKV